MNGTIHHFEWRGLYDGVSVLMDRETGSLWHHVTGEALYGPLAGTVLPVDNLLHTTVGEALARDPALSVAVSDRPITGTLGRWAPWLEKIPVLGERIRSTMARRDTRRPDLDVGLGLWTETASTYYPLERVRAADDVVVDRLDGRGVVVYFERAARVLMALYTDAHAARWEGETLRLDDGSELRGGILYGRDGTRLAIERPLQLFTRWYGYALMLPETRIWAQ